ncbi:integrase core domain-containing protein [Mycobacteroides abscessus subsp. abscessus]|nr:integrase core domain-containing protein [Mycobacteroides abscessus subsp. abscessus]
MQHMSPFQLALSWCYLSCQGTEVRLTDKDQFGVEAICRVLRQADRGFITSRGYRKATTRTPSARALSDSLLIPEIQRVHAENFSVYGIRKMWHAMNREGFHIGRGKTARLMKLAGVCGRRRGRTPLNNVQPEDTGSSPRPGTTRLPCTSTRQALGCRHYLRSHPVRVRLHRVCRGYLQQENCWCCYTLDDAYRCAADGGFGACVNDCRANPWKPVNSPQ